jgi:hypothetical protein
MELRQEGWSAAGRDERTRALARPARALKTLITSSFMGRRRTPFPWHREYQEPSKLCTLSPIAARLPSKPCLPPNKVVRRVEEEGDLLSVKRRMPGYPTQEVNDLR